MIINLNTILVDYEGNPIKDGEKETPLTFKKVVLTAVNALDVKTVVDDKIRAFNISILMNSVDSVDFSVEDLAFIKKKVGEIYNALVLGRMTEIIEKKDDTK